MLPTKQAAVEEADEMDTVEKRTIFGMAALGVLVAEVAVETRVPYGLSVCSRNIHY